MQPPFQPSSEELPDDELDQELASETSEHEAFVQEEFVRPKRRRVERLVEESRRLRREELLAKARLARMAHAQREAEERDARERAQLETEAQSIPPDPEFEAWLEGRHRVDRAPTRSHAASVPLPPRSPDRRVARRQWWREAHGAARLDSAPDNDAPNDALASEVNAKKKGSHVSKPPSRARRIARRVLLTGALLGVAWGIVFALSSPRMEVVGVDVSGARLTNPESVARVQALLVGQNWARARTGEAQRQLAAIPTVRVARVSRVWAWPPKLRIVLQERQSFARVGGGRDWWVVDEVGVTFRRANETPADFALLPLTGPSFAPQIGRALPPETWKSAAKLVRDLQAQSARSEQPRRATASAPAPDVTLENASENGALTLRRVYFDRAGAASLRIANAQNDGLLVRLGSDDWTTKLRRAQDALRYFARTGRRAQTLDLVSFNRPVWTERASISLPEARVNGQNRALLPNTSTLDSPVARTG